MVGARKMLRVRFAVHNTDLSATHFVYTTLLCDDEARSAEITSRKDYFLGPLGVLIMTSGDEPDNAGNQGESQ